MPTEAIKRLKRMKAAKTLAVPIVLYGNREFEDALLELRDLVVELGFIPVAGGAFIGNTLLPLRTSPSPMDVRTVWTFKRPRISV